MARYYVTLPDWDPNTSALGGTTEENADVQVLAFRDAYRAALDPDLLATNWMVSDVAKWQGLSGTANGYAFTIFHRSGGSNTGPAWTWILPGNNGANESEFNEIVEAAQASTYFFDTGGGVNLGFDGTPGIHYSQFGGTTDPYDFGYNLADGTLAGGDLSAPTTNPYTDLVTFMPATPLRGFVFDNQGDSQVQSRFLTVADDEKPFLTFYATQGLLLEPGYLVTMGNIIVPYRSTDVETHGALSFEVSFSNSAQGALGADCLQVQTDTGALLITTDFFNDIFTSFNVPLSDGTYPWDVIALQDPAYFKGWIDSDVIRVMGPNNRDLNSLYDGGNFVKFTQTLCFPYVPNRTIWPSSPGS